MAELSAPPGGPIRRRCAQPMRDGTPCRAAPLHESAYCRLHDPEHADEVARARRQGGLRRRKETVVELSYDLPGLDSVAGIRRLLEIVATDALAHDPPQPRIVLAAAAQATKLLEVGELADEVEALKAALRLATSGAGGSASRAIYNPETTGSMLRGTQ